MMCLTQLRYKKYSENTHLTLLFDKPVLELKAEKRLKDVSECFIDIINYPMNSTGIGLFPRYTAVGAASNSLNKLY